MTFWVDADVIDIQLFTFLSGFLAGVIYFFSLSPSPMVSRLGRGGEAQYSKSPACGVALHVLRLVDVPLGALGR